MNEHQDKQHSCDLWRCALRKQGLTTTKAPECESEAFWYGSGAST
jgi:hypothetical protein